MKTREEKLITSLTEALRYIEVSVAYEGSMTAAQVEQRIKDNANIMSTQICANSVTPLAQFDFAAARDALEMRRVA